MPDGSDRENGTMSCLQCGLEVHLKFVSPALRIPKVERPVAA